MKERQFNDFAKTYAAAHFSRHVSGVATMSAVLTVGSSHDDGHSLMVGAPELLVYKPEQFCLGQGEKPPRDHNDWTK